MNFSELNLNQDLMKGLEAAGYEKCTPVQELFCIFQNSLCLMKSLAISTKTQ